MRKLIRLRPRRRGFSMIYFMLAMLVLMGCVAMAVDVGRAQWSKGQLQTAADGAAHAAAWYIPTDLGGGTARALAVAKANTCNGQSIVITNADVVYGNWNSATRTFTPQVGTIQPDSVKVTTYATVPTTFAAVVGLSAFGPRASAIAHADVWPNGQYALFGNQSVNIGGNSDIIVNSYNSGSGSNGNVAIVGSNGPITIKGSVTVNSNVLAGVGQPKPQPQGAAVVTGTLGNLTQPVTLLPVDATPYATNNNNAALGSMIDKNGNFSASGNTTIGSGVYYVNDLTLGKNATLTINANSGPVVFYVTGSVKVDGSFGATGVPAPVNFEINVAGSGSVTLNGNSDLYGVINAPGSDVKLSGTNDFFGSVVGNTITVTGTPTFHYDSSLSGTLRNVSLVK